MTDDSPVDGRTTRDRGFEHDSPANARTSRRGCLQALGALTAGTATAASLTAGVTAAGTSGADRDDTDDADRDGPSDGSAEPTPLLSPETCNGEEDLVTLENGQNVCDHTGDGHYRDVNGDGSVSNSDVTEFFLNQHVEPWDSRTDLFDFDGNGDVGQGDVIDLFEYIN